MLFADWASDVPDWFKAVIGIALACMSIWFYYRKKQNEVDNAEQKKQLELRWAEVNYYLAQHREMLVLCEKRHEDDAVRLNEIIGELNKALDGLRERIIVLEREKARLEGMSERSKAL
jgi:hypothetical protein